MTSVESCPSHSGFELRKRTQTTKTQSSLCSPFQTSDQLTRQTMALVAVEEVHNNCITSKMLHMKVLKQSANLIQRKSNQQEPRKQPSFGICFDIDGVIARGTVPIPAAVKAFHRLVDERGKTRLPIAFVTNSLSRNEDKAEQLSTILGIKVFPDQVIQAPGPLVMFNELHDKFCLVVGQGQILDIAHDLGFKNVCTIEDIANAYPLLDVVDHDNRTQLALHGFTEKEFPKVEAVVLLGEPKRWESSLQLLIDLLRTGGRPNKVPSSSALREQLPVVACNMDLEFMHRAAIPRYGHGAFLICLEALYQKITGKDLQYTALVGKPSEITFRYAEHVLASQSRILGFSEPIKTMYLVGDTPDSDIAGSNLYQSYVDRKWNHLKAADATNNTSPPHTIDDVIQTDPINPTAKRPSKELSPSETGCPVNQYYDPDIPASRNVPSEAVLHRAMVERVVPILVCTGVYQPSTKQRCDDDNAVAKNNEDYDIKKVPHHGHRDFPNNAELYKPSKLCDDVCTAVDYILQQEAYS